MEATSDRSADGGRHGVDLKVDDPCSETMNHGRSADKERLMHARFNVLRSHWEPWEVLFQKAADFLTAIGPGRTIGVSHSQEGNIGVVTVWYWSDEPAHEQ